MFGFGILPLILVAGGLYFVMRKDGDAPAGGGAAPVPSKELLTADGLAKRFEADLTAFKVADPTFTNEKEARTSFYGGDNRPRALAMMEFVASSYVGNPLSEVPISEAARKAALALAVDYRDQFEFLEKKGELAQKLMDETVALLKGFAKMIQDAGADPGKKAEAMKAMSDAKVYAGVDRASRDLIVDTPIVAQLAGPVVAGADTVVAANILDAKSGLPVGTAQVSVSSSYRMQSAAQTLPTGVTVDAFIGRIVEGTLTGDGKVFDLKGLYPVVFAPRAP